MKRNKLLCIIISVFLLSCIEVHGQTIEITEKEFYQQYRTATQKGREISSRSVTKRENFRDGILSSKEEYIFAYLLPDKKFYSHKESFSDKTQTVELIQIGEIYYCRRNNEEWKQSKNWCAGGSAFGLPNKISSKFTIEVVNSGGEKLKLYQEYTTYKNTYSPNKDKEGLSYWQKKFWINEAGLVIKEESENGLIEPVQIRWRQVETYEYNPKDLKIEAPID